MQHKGIGSTLIRHMLDSGPDGVPWVVIANPPARLFYEKHGFKMIGTGHENEENLADILYEWKSI